MATARAGREALCFRLEAPPASQCARIGSTARPALALATCRDGNCKSAYEARAAMRLRRRAQFAAKQASIHADVGRSAPSGRCAINRLLPSKLYRYFNYIRVRSFILNGAPLVRGRSRSAAQGPESSVSKIIQPKCHTDCALHPRPARIDRAAGR